MSDHALDGNRPLPFDRDTLGRFVREAWVRWAETQPSPKPSWLLPYDDLAEIDKEADRQIGEDIARWTLIGDALTLSRLEEHLKNIEETADAISSPQRMSIIRKQALAALALISAQPRAAEPVAWRRMNADRSQSTGVTDTTFYRDLWKREGSIVEPLYTGPE